MNETLAVYFTTVLAAGVTAQWLAWRLRIPSILVLLVFGIGIGQAFGGYEKVSDLLPSHLLFPLVSLSVAVIMLEGGLTLHWKELSEAGTAVFRMVTAGALVTWIGATIAAITILQWSTAMATLLGAILVVTGPTVVVPLLRLVRPSRKIASVVKWEGIVIDPIGAILAVIVFEVVRASGSEEAARVATMSIVKSVTFATLIAFVVGIGFIEAARRFMIPDFLHNPAVLALAIVAFTASNLIQKESGLVCVTVLGMILANQKRIQLRHVVEFKENLQVLIIACLFILIGSRIDLGAIADLSWPTVGFLVVLIVVVRPVSVFLATVGTDLSRNEKVFLSFLAPRGIVAAAVSSVFALELSHVKGLDQAARSQAEQLAPMTIVVILATVAFYGLFAAPLASWLGLSARNDNGIVIGGASKWVRSLAKLLIGQGVPVTLVDTNYSHVAAANMDGIPAECASVFGEHVHEMDLSGVGRFLALTPSDEVNALAMKEWTHLVGRANVFQLAPSERSGSPRDSVGTHLQGRILFHDTLTFDELEWRMERGATLKATKITEEFTFAEHAASYQGTVEPLFAIDPTSRLLVNAVDDPLNIQPGYTLISLVPAT